LVLGCGVVAQVGEGELVGGRMFQGDLGMDLEVAVDGEQFRGA
jgi:hypothetical protein